MLRLRYLIAISTILGSITAAMADTPEVPEGVAPLTETEILQLFDGKTFEFTSYDEPVTGTTTWDDNKGTVSGSYILDEEQKGDFKIKWFLKDGMSCIDTGGKKPQCQIIYPYNTGFMEVRPDGVVHAVSTPVE